MPRDPNDQLLVLNHEIRQTESYLKTAQRRRRRSDISFIFGPVVLAFLYGTWWVPHISHHLLVIIDRCSGTFRRSLLAIATVKLNLTPGGPPEGKLEFGYARKRVSEDELELNLARQRDAARNSPPEADTPIAVRRIAYKDEAYTDIDEFRAESARYRSVNNALQSVLIIGSLAATELLALTAEVPDIRWVTLGFDIRRSRREQDLNRATSNTKSEVSIFSRRLTQLKANGKPSRLALAGTRKSTMKTPG